MTSDDWTESRADWTDEDRRRSELAQAVAFQRWHTYAASRPPIRGLKPPKPEGDQERES